MLEKLNKMEDQLISFETAKLAKEKEFNISCENVYAETLEHEDYDRHTGIEYDVEYRAPIILNRDCLYEYTKFVCEAPTQSLLQKWIREEYDIIVLIDYFYWDDCFKFNIGGKSVNPDKLKGIDFSIEFDLYEDALEAGLFEALNLIK